MKQKEKVTRKSVRPKLYHYRGCGLDNIYLEGGVNYIQTPRGKTVQIEDTEGLHRAIGRWLVHEKKKLTGKEFRFLRHELNLTQQDLAALLRVGVQSVGRWERGETEIPGPAQGLIALLYAEKANGNTAVSEPLERLAELDEKMAGDEGIKFLTGPEGWSIAA